MGCVAYKRGGNYILVCICALFFGKCSLYLCLTAIPGCENCHVALARLVIPSFRLDMDSNNSCKAAASCQSQDE